jgi:hypothetical protein
MIFSGATLFGAVHLFNAFFAIVLSIKCIKICYLLFVISLYCNRERIYILHLTVLAKDKRLIVTAVLLHQPAVG